MTNEVQFLTGVDVKNKNIVNVADPSAATHAANKQYVDNLVSGLSYKNEVVAASTANGTLATAYENGDTLDGITLATGNRILLKDQTTQSENGIYVVAASGAPTRATDADTTAEMNNATVYVTGGTVNGGREYTQTTKDPTVGSSSIVWVQKTSGVSYTADGDGIELSSTTFSLELDGTTLSKSASGLRIGSGAAGAGLTQASGVLAVGAGTGITVNADDVAVDTAVVARKYAADCAATTNPQTFTHALGTDITCQVWEVSTGIQVQTQITKNATSGGQVIVEFGAAPTSAQYRIVVIG